MNNVDTSKLNDKSFFIFDMDGTLVNLEDLNRQGYIDTVKKFFDIDMPHEDYQRHFSGSRTEEGFESYLNAKQIADFDIPELVRNFRKQKRYNLENNLGKVVKLIPGTKEYLRLLKKQNKRLALATSTIRDFTEIILKHFEIYDIFEYVLTAEDVNEGKPDPEMYLLALDKLQADRQNSVVFEDSKNGIAAAKAAGIYTIGIHTKGLNDEWVNDADYVMKDYFELL